LISLKKTEGYTFRLDFPGYFRMVHRAKLWIILELIFISNIPGTKH